MPLDSPWDVVLYDINNICVNLIKVSKVWLLKNLHALHYWVDGISLSPSQLSDAPLSLIGAPQSLPNYIGQFGSWPDPHPWWPILPCVDVRCKIFMPGQACVVLKRLVHAWARQSLNVPSINTCIDYLMPISIHVVVSLVATQACMKSRHNPRPGKRCSGHKPNWPYISLVHTYTCPAALYI